MQQHVSIPSNVSTKGRILGWGMLRTQLLTQWNEITGHELDEAGPSRQRVARLIQRKYGIAESVVETYLHHFERTLPAI